MKSIAIIFVLITVLLITSCEKSKDRAEHDHNSATSTVTPDTVKKSIPQEEHAQIGDAHISIRYHAPAVRGRTIWGGLVPYNDVWVTGAHSATSFEINKDFSVNNTRIPAGKYAVFTIPGKEKWIIIINRNWDQHLADEYDVKDDIVRFEATPTMRDTVQERLKYTIAADGDRKAVMRIQWELMEVSMPFELL